jgi:hypothetical protein
MGSILVPSVAHGVPDEEAFEIARINRRVLQQAALAVDPLDDASPGATNGADDDGDRRRVEPPVSFCWAAFHGDAKHPAIRSRFLAKPAALRSSQVIIGQIFT